MMATAPRTTIVVPLTADDIQWTPFTDGTESHTRESLRLTLLGLSDDEIRACYVSLWENRNALRAACHEALAMLTRSSLQQDRYRAAVYELRGIQRQAHGKERRS